MRPEIKSALKLLAEWLIKEKLSSKWWKRLKVGNTDIKKILSILPTVCEGDLVVLAVLAAVRSAHHACAGLVLPENSFHRIRDLTHRTPEQPKKHLICV